MAWVACLLTGTQFLIQLNDYKKLTDRFRKKTSYGFYQKRNFKNGILREINLERSLGGIAYMKKPPEMIFIIDTNIRKL